jgi:uncharacterized protein DUF3574
MSGRGGALGARLARIAPLTMAAAVIVGGCASAPEPACPAGERRSVDELLYFGTGMAHGVVSDEQWAAFLRDVVTPRFPDGLTTWPASGQWRAGDGSLTLENTHVLNLVHAADDATEKAVQAIVADYKDRFRQEAVLRVKTSACVSF